MLLFCDMNEHCLWRRGRCGVGLLNPPSQAIKDEYEKAIFGGRRGSMSTVSGASPSSGVPYCDTSDRSGTIGGPMDYHDRMGHEYGSSG